jgi:hypothetical protein
MRHLFRELYESAADGDVGRGDRRLSEDTRDVGVRLTTLDARDNGLAIGRLQPLQRSPVACERLAADRLLDWDGRSAG